MTFSTKILLAPLSFVLAGGILTAHADVTAKETQAEKFEAATESPKTVADDQSALTVRDEMANEKTEGGSCQLVCHPAFTVDTKTSLAKIDLNKIK